MNWSRQKKIVSWRYLPWVEFYCSNSTLHLGILIHPTPSADSRHLLQGVQKKKKKKSHELGLCRHSLSLFFSNLSHISLSLIQSAVLEEKKRTKTPAARSCHPAGSRSIRRSSGIVLPRARLKRTTPLQRRRSTSESPVHSQRTANRSRSIELQRCHPSDRRNKPADSSGGHSSIRPPPAAPPFSSASSGVLFADAGNFLSCDFVPSAAADSGHFSAQVWYRIYSALTAALTIHVANLN